MFTSAVSLQSSDINSVTSLNIKPNSRGGIAKKVTNSPYKQFVEVTQKKIKQATKSKNNWLASALLSPSKRRNRRICRDPTLSATQSDSDTDLAVLFADDLT
jgi:hypothetical protein